MASSPDRMTLTLVPVGLEHAERIQALASHPEIVATTRLPDPYPADGALEFLRYVMPRHAEGSEYAFAVIDERVGLVGTCGLHHVVRERGEAELGFWVGRPYWGRGFASAAARLGVALAFGALGFDRLVAHALSDNVASRRVLERAGFTLDRYDTHRLPKWPVERELALYQLTRAGWRKGQG